MSSFNKLVTHSLTLALLLGFTTVLRAQPPVQPETKSKENPHRWAILIGVDDYAQLNDLQFCGADQRALRDQLIAAGFPDQQIFLLHDKAEDKKYQPFKANIEKQLALVLGLVEKGDTVIVAFSGHGVQSGKTPYLCPTEAELDKPTSMVSLDWVYEQLRDCPATLRLLLVDACRNDPRLGSPRSTTPSDETRKLAKSLEQPQPEGILLLTSCSAGEISMEEKTFGHGVFMHYLLEGLKGAADADKNGRVSLGELSNFAGSETKLYVARKFNESQRPKLRGDLTIEALGFELSDVSLPKEIVSKSTGMKLTLIPAGTFSMGSSAADVRAAVQADPDFKEESFKNEQPQHTVRISKPFYMGVYEVTQGEYENVRGTNPSRFSKTGGGQSDVSGLDTGQFPVENVSWFDAVEFCNTLSVQDGLPAYYALTNVQRESGSIRSATVSEASRAASAPGLFGYRLPTEAEWEYACRAGSTSVWHTGNTLASLNEAGWWWAYTNPTENSEHRTHRVGQKTKNAFGLYDMHGNVWEWCSDWHGGDYYAKSPTDDPQGPSAGSSRVFRGGGFVAPPVLLRCACRSAVVPSSCLYVRGFRVVSVR